MKFGISKLTEKCISSKLNIFSFIISDSLTDMQLNEKYLAYLSVLKYDRLAINPLKLLNSIDELYKFLSKSENWYTFLKNIHIYEKFLEYNIQKQIERINLVKIKSSGYLGKLQETDITQTNFKEFLGLIHGFDINHGILGNIQHSELQLKKLNHVLKMTLNDNIEPECKQNEIVIRRNFIKFTDFTYA